MSLLHRRDLPRVDESTDPKEGKGSRRNGTGKGGEKK